MKTQLIILCLLICHAYGFMIFRDQKSFLGKGSKPTVASSEQRDCCFLTGTWVNQHGSVLILNHAEDGTLSGEFLTAVETSKGASNGIQSLHGRVGMGRPTTFGMVVTFKNGSSTSAWSGQYHLCNGRETLLTTWILTAGTDACEGHWMATRVGQDRFVRKVSSKMIKKWLPGFKKNKKLA